MNQPESPLSPPVSTPVFRQELLPTNFLERAGDAYADRIAVKDIIISGGENISTVEVEQAVVSHPAVLECAVVPIPFDLGVGARDWPHQ